MINSSTRLIRKFTLLAGTAGLALGLALGSSAFAQTKGSGGAGHDSGAGHEAGSHDTGSTHEGGTGKKLQKGRNASGGAGGHGSLRDVFREMEDEAAADSGHGSDSHGSSGKKAGKSADKGKKASGASQSADKGKQKPSTTADKGKKGKPATTEAAEGEDETSDRPTWAGTSGPESKPGRPNLEPGVKKGTIYGDMYVIERNADGVPILDADGYVKVLYTDATTGTLVCCILRDAEGNLLPTLADGTAVVPIEVELGRLSVGRSPTRVLAAQLDEATKSITAASSITLDAAGRIVLVAADGTTKTIDSPLENLALYTELMNTGTIAGIDLSSIGINASDDLTADELKIASSFLAAASDKTIPVTVDTVEYMNTILGLEPTLDANGDGEITEADASFVDYSSFTYDRASTYDNMTVNILVTTDGGTTWVTQTVNVYDAVFASTALTASNVAGFTAAADDARSVINFIHEYSVPALPTTTN